MTTRTASCSCGRLTATTEGEPLRVSICHCHACQRRTGSVFGAQARFRRDAVTLAGEGKTWSHHGDEGAEVRFTFCPTCGATVWYTVEGYDVDTLAIPVGAFADAAFPAPTVSVYEERMHPWVHLPDTVNTHIP
ncbi:MAG: GFA family protein [Deltaproteobacteria bacterium]|nr:MAG: GFA family protein [Deltaproteobacteria bacterium]